MATEKPFTLEGSNRLSPVVDDSATLLVGSGIDASTAGSLTIGATNATSIVMTAPVTLPATQTGTIQKKTVTIAFDNAALTATSGSANGTAATVNISTALPANARIVGVDLNTYTPFTGGSVSAVALDIGSSGDIDALVDGADLFAAAVDGGPSTRPTGIRPNKIYATATQLIATLTPDAGHKLSALTAGSVVIDVIYTILA